MTTHYKTQAFVFKKSDSNDSDRIFHTFTDKFGRLDIFAKAIRKNASKLRGGIDVFSISEIEFINGRSKMTLTDAVFAKKFVNIWQSPEKFMVANRIVEVFNNFIKSQDPDQNIFYLLDESFSKLDGYLEKEKNILIYYYFLWNMFSLSGYHLQVYKCAGCGEKLIPYNVYFSGKEGGIICKQCSSKDKFSTKVNSDIVKILRIILSKDWHTLSKLKISAVSHRLLHKVSEDAIHTFSLTT